MRIQVAVDTWGLIGGSERYAADVVRELLDRGHAVRVLAGQHLGAVSNERGERHQVDVVPAYAAPSGSNRGRDSRPADLDQLEACVRRWAPDVLLVLSLRNRAAAGRLAALRPAVPTVRFVQDHTLFCPALNKLHADGSPCRTAVGAVCLEHYFLRTGCTGWSRSLHPRPLLDGVAGVAKTLADLTLAGRCQRLLVASGYMRRELLDAGLPTDLVQVLPYFTRSNTPDLPSTPPPEATVRFLARSGAPLVFTPARLALPDKGLDRLLEALALVGAPWRAVIAGSGPAEGELRGLVETLGLTGRVHFAGWLEPGAIESLYAQADVVAFPSVWDEPFGLVGLEAMAHARPVVAFDVGGVGDWLRDTESGLLVPRGDVAGLAHALEEVLADSEQARAMGRAGRARLAREFTPEQHVRGLERVLAEAVSRA